MFDSQSYDCENDHNIVIFIARPSFLLSINFNGGGGGFKKQTLLYLPTLQIIVYLFSYSLLKPESFFPENTILFWRNWLQRVEILVSKLKECKQLFYLVDKTYQIYWFNREKYLSIMKSWAKHTLTQKEKFHRNLVKFERESIRGCIPLNSWVIESQSRHY